VTDVSKIGLPVLKILILKEKKKKTSGIDDIAKSLNIGYLAFTVL